MNTGQEILKNAIENGFDNMATWLYAGAVVIVLLVLRMVKVSLDTSKYRRQVIGPSFGVCAEFKQER